MRREAFFRLVSPRALWNTGEDGIGALERVFGRGLAELPKVTMGQVSALRAFDAIDKLPGLRAIPALVVSATEDIIAPPAQGKAIAEALAGGFVEVAGAMP